MYIIANLVSTNLFNLAVNHQILGVEKLADIKRWTRIRNYAVHSDEKVSSADATEIVNGVYALIDSMQL